MKIKAASLLLLICNLFCQSESVANFVKADPNNYTSYLQSLKPGDTLFLAGGNYTNQLNLQNINGTAQSPIVVMGVSTGNVIFKGNACCNTVSIVKSSYLVIRDITLDGQDIAGIDGIKAEGTSGNWAHHITIEKVKIIGHGGDQQTDGISTKCPTWDWVIRKCIIDGAGTGLYLGNSDGTDPFVNGLIEGNLISNSVGYCIEIKHQNDGLRTVPGMTLSGKTILRNNVFCKGANSSSGGSERPNVLLGGFPSTGDGSHDYYEVYQNFFYNNPNEGLFQGTGNIALYNNVFVNHDTGWGVQIREHEGSQPRTINIFHNTIVVANGTGLNFYNSDPSYKQIAAANAIFASTPINSNTSISLADNVTDTYNNSTKYLLRPLSSIPDLKVQPLSDQLTGSISSSSAFESYTNWDIDFSGNKYNWTYRGAYSFLSSNTDWKLACDTMSYHPSIITQINYAEVEKKLIEVYPNPMNESASISHGFEKVEEVFLVGVDGRKYHLEQTNIYEKNLEDYQTICICTKEIPSGLYTLFLNGRSNKNQKIIVSH